MTGTKNGSRPTAAGSSRSRRAARSGTVWTASSPKGWSSASSTWRAQRGGRRRRAGDEQDLLGRDARCRPARRSARRARASSRCPARRGRAAGRRRASPRRAGRGQGVEVPGHRPRICPSDARARRHCQADWLGASRRATGGAAPHPARGARRAQERVEETGDRGEGGDQTLVIDQGAEDAVFAELEQLHDGGARFSALSEERGLVDFGSEDVLVVIDPIDGSMNAKRGLTHHAISIAVAAGHTMGDMEFGYVFDFGPDEEWVAQPRRRACCSTASRCPSRRRRATTTTASSSSSRSSRADPRWIAKRMDDLVEHVHRVRAMGTIAVSLCQVALTRVDGMATLWKTRSVDAAAAQLIVRESGGFVAFPGCDAPLGLAARPRAERARRRRAHARGPRAAGRGGGATDDRLGPRRADRGRRRGHAAGGTALAGDLDGVRRRGARARRRLHRPDAGARRSRRPRPSTAASGCA